ncbi:succinyl-CoA synthetase alpha subunit [Desulfonauticus submarinus]|uniref:Succinate--CoA ligase [ADP-forming] subunit alpha n=1 Tax=Desulfonauticus submarinus TaxID=206665 RepID=A0A1H0A1H4_9BACT|nr:succinate--CoA ligase subunit alpha [Desulfonauticus submarinus]SDN27021.1 succinyl-CoA synthetase alpha subunit [Desulfonauticus submarinus]
MKLNEHKSKLLLSQYNIPIPNGCLVYPKDINDFQTNFDFPWVIKAQVLTGGRGKAGGIKIVSNKNEFLTESKKILNMKIKGENVPFLRIEQTISIQKEFYISFSICRNKKAVVFTTGKEGGINIEESGKENLLIQKIDLNYGIKDFQIKNSFFHLKQDKNIFNSYYQLIKKIYNLFIQNKALLVEINPMVLTLENNFVALDAKIELDDSYVDICPELNKYYSPEHKTKIENTAREFGLSFHKLNGFVGMIVNGAGLAMATMDILNFSNLPPANFLDLGGGATPERMEKAFSLLFQDKDVKIIFINIFGGILSCDKVAKALASVLTSPPPKKIVIRFSGFKSQEARQIIKKLNFSNIFLASDLEEAVSILAKQTKTSLNLQFSKCFTENKQIKDSTPLSSTFPLNQYSQVLVQGITGKEGTLHTKQMLEYGTKIVAGVTPFKENETVFGVPVFNSVHNACKQFKIDASIIFVPAKFAPDAILEAIDANIPYIVCITEGIPQQEMLKIIPYLKNSNSILIGPNTPGLIIPNQIKIGIMPHNIFRQGNIAVLSRSGTLTYECVYQLNKIGLGQSICIGIGGDPFVGTNFKEIIPFLEKDSTTQALLVLGEIGGNAEEDLSFYLKKINFSKPCFAFIAGQTAPPGKRLGHAGAILEGESTLQDKLKTLKENNFILCSQLNTIAQTIQSYLHT